jgi:hypothetical protein
MPEYIVDLERMQVAQVGVDAQDADSAAEEAVRQVMDEDWTTLAPHQAYAKRCPND